MLRDVFFDRSDTPPCGDARRGIREVRLSQSISYGLWRKRLDPEDARWLGRGATDHNAAAARSGAI